LQYKAAINTDIELEKQEQIEQTDLFSYIDVENLERNITTNISRRFCEIVLPPGKQT